MPFILAISLALVALLHVIGLPGAFLLGAMGAALILAGLGSTRRLPRTFALPQAVAGCLMAHGFTPAVSALPAGTTLSVGAALSVLLVPRRRHVER
jgi:uncharacterized membrane protein AbrB (regulator of aidB expression)